jgi:hypothetical protein
LDWARGLASVPRAEQAQETLGYSRCLHSEGTDHVGSTSTEVCSWLSRTFRKAGDATPREPDATEDWQAWERRCHTEMVLGP